MYKYKFNKYIYKLDMIMSAGEINNIYLLITTEFKRTSKKLGRLEDYSKKVAEILNDINSELFKKIKEIQIYRLPRQTLEYVDSIRELNSKKTKIETNMINILENFFELDYNESCDDIINNYLEKYDQKSLIRKIGIEKYKSLLIDYKEYISLELQKRSAINLVQTYKEEEKDRRRLIQSRLEENYMIGTDLLSMYRDKLIRGSEFRAVILNHHYFSSPYLHVLYTVLKYDAIKKSVYVDIFVSVAQYVKDNEVRQREYFPKMFDETMSGNGFADKYATKIYETMKKDLSNYNLLMGRLLFLNNHVFSETGNNIDFDKHYAHLKLQKNFAQYLSGKVPIDDNQTKVKLCNIKSVNSVKGDEKYDYVVNKTWELIKEMGILNDKFERGITIDKSYTVIATSIELLKQNIIVEKNGEEDGHAEAQLMKKFCNNTQLMNGFKSGSDMIYVMRYYKNGNIGCGLPCSRCVSVLTSNTIHKVIYSMDHEYYQYCNMNNTTYTYTTTGNKLLNTDTYLYEDYLLEFK
jgi:hypothetical protein